MRTCHRLAWIKARAEREIAYHAAHASKHAGEQSAKQSTTMAALARQGMAMALSQHYAKCPECS